MQDSSLDRGAGHFPGTALPGDLGNVVILGHRTTHLAPFRDLNLLRRGDEIFLSAGRYVYRYQVRVSKISTPSDSSLVSPDPLGDTGSPRRLATLITCHPKGSSAKRFVVIAELVKRVRRA